MSAPTRFAFVAVLASLLTVPAAQAAATDSGASSSAPPSHEAQGGLPSGKRMHKPMTIRKEIDRTTPTSAPSGASAGPAADQAKTKGAPLKGVDVKLGR